MCFHPSHASRGGPQSCRVTSSPYGVPLCVTARHSTAAWLRSVQQTDGEHAPCRASSARPPDVGSGQRTSGSRKLHQAEGCSTQALAREA